MKLVSNWKKILKKAWSVRFTILAGTLSALELALPYLGDFLPRGVFAALSLIASKASVISRIVSQEGVK